MGIIITHNYQVWLAIVENKRKQLKHVETTNQLHSS